jgi:nitroreductase/NAD-dependent dihydropyrimidine dehydrogenase PreA subunit
MPTDYAISINPEICRKCGLCVKACIHAKLKQPDKSAPPRVVENMDCIACGHCVSICPSGALSHSAFPSGSVQPLDADLLPTADQMMEALRARRSYRKFKDNRIPHETLEQVVEAARLAPSAHNSQTTSFIVVEDPEMLKRVVDLTVNFLDGLAKYFRHPIKGRIAKLMGGDQVKGVLPLIPVFEGVVQLARSGAKLPMLLDAPAWIVFHSEKNAGYGAVNASCAMQNAMLMADRLGLGTFFTGFLLAPAMRGFLLHDLLGLDHEREIHGALAVGVPELQYKKWPSKKSANVRWI